MVAMIVMKGDLRFFKFLFSLEKRFSTDYAEMLVRAEKYANVEEAMAAQKETSSCQAEKGTRGKGRSPLTKAELPDLRTFCHPGSSRSTLP